MTQVSTSKVTVFEAALEEPLGACGLHLLLNLKQTDW
jgi:hypothetical protein